MALKEVTNDTFEQTVKADGVTVLDFWAAWCGPCRSFAPVFEATAEKFPEATFGKVDTEANQEISAALQIQSIPTLMLFRDGVLLYRESGVLPANALESLVKEAEGLDMNEVKAQIVEAQSGDADVDVDSTP